MARLVIQRERKLMPLVFWVKGEDAMHVIAVLKGLITVACDVNHMKRFVPPR